MQNNNERLINIIRKKQTAVCLALDIPDWKTAKPVLMACASYICMVKLHCDLIHDWSADVIIQLKAIAAEYEFLVMQDSKLSDVPKIVYRQLTEPPYSISEWADYVTIQPLNYLDTYDFIMDNGRQQQCPMPQLVCVAEMNTLNSFSKNPEYLALVRELLTSNPDKFAAVVCQRLDTILRKPIAFINATAFDRGTYLKTCGFCDNAKSQAGLLRIPESVIKMSPGVCIHSSDENNRYRTIRNAMQRDGNHVVIIGASLINSSANTEDLSHNIKTAAAESWRFWHPR
jgi:orotidine-5'-phosphate decarboxylase